jgi:hypothetical protein
MQSVITGEGVGRWTGRVAKPADWLGGWPIAALAAAPLLIWLVATGQDHYFRDELYYLAASRHLAFGYVDFPPLTAVLVALNRALFGDSLLALRLFPALAAGAAVLMAALLAGALGGGRFAQTLAGLATLVAPNDLAEGALFSMDVFDRVWWVSAAYVLVRILRGGSPRLWLLFGLLAGLGLQTKVTMLYFGFALLVGLLLTPARRHLRTRWFWLGGALAGLIFLPYVLWQIPNGWPTLEFWAHYGGKVQPESPLGFLVQQVVTMHPLTLPLWLAGLGFFFFAAAGKPFRPLGWAFATLWVIFTLQNAKSYFLAPAYPMLYAGGAVLAERLARRPAWGWLRPTALAGLGVGGLLLLPAAVPILSPESYVRLTAPFGGAEAGPKQERQQLGALPQHFADRQGWVEMVATVAGAYARLSPAERAVACIYMTNYGRAGAIDFYGPRYGLPPAISGHNSYYLWGPRGCSGEVVLTTGGKPEELGAFFARVEQVATVTCAYCMPYENNLPVYVLRGARQPVSEVWATTKSFD